MNFGGFSNASSNLGTRVDPRPTLLSQRVPLTAVMVEQTGSQVGQINLRFWKPRFLQGRDPVALAPVTDTIFYVSDSEEAALAGEFDYSGNAGVASTVTIPGVAAGTWYVTSKCINANGESDLSPIVPVVVTT